jgi:hypothetical protein
MSPPLPLRSLRLPNLVICGTLISFIGSEDMRHALRTDSCPINDCIHTLGQCPAPACHPSLWNPHLSPPWDSHFVRTLQHLSNTSLSAVCMGWTQHGMWRSQKRSARPYSRIYILPTESSMRRQVRKTNVSPTVNIYSSAIELCGFNLDSTSWSLEEYREKGISVDDYNNDIDQPQYESTTAVIPGRSKEILRDRPCNLRDKNGRIWCWFFPGLMSKKRQVSNY